MALPRGLEPRLAVSTTAMLITLEKNDLMTKIRKDGGVYPLSKQWDPQFHLSMKTIWNL